MDLRKILLKGSDGNPSVTTTAFVLGFLIVCIKLLLAGLEIKGFKFPDFTGTDFATAVGALGAVYVLRRHSEQSVSNGKGSKKK